jgi:hypothetical protein
MIQWLMESARDVEDENEKVVSRLLMVNFATINPVAVVFCTPFGLSE